jgi:carboxyl-terminal processing protease
MNARTKFIMVFLSTLLTVMLVIGALMGKSKEGDATYKPLSVYTEVLARIKADYVEEPNMDKVTRGALQGLVEFLDPLSSYLTAEQFELFEKSRENADDGTGLSTGLVVFKQRLSYTQILYVVPGSPADQAGIRKGDLIEAIDGASTRSMAPAHMQSVLSGKPGTRVRLLVRPARQPDEPQEHALERAGVELPSVASKMLEDRVGYIDLDVLDGKHVDQVAAAIKSLESEGAKKFILDLRGNALGDAKQGLMLADHFISEGKLGSLKGQRYPEEIFTAEAETTLTDAPIVLITDRATASGAELAAAAILDSGRGKIAGERTYGLAAFQKTIRLDDGAALILSVAKYYRPSGKAFQDGGVEPSDPVATAELRRYRISEMETMEIKSETTPPSLEGDPEKDPYLKKALEVLKNSSKAVKKAA